MKTATCLIATVCLTLLCRSAAPQEEDFDAPPGEPAGRFERTEYQVQIDRYWEDQHRQAQHFGLGTLAALLPEEIAGRQRVFDENKKWLAQLKPLERTADAETTRKWIAQEQKTLVTLNAELREVLVKRKAERDAQAAKNALPPPAKKSSKGSP